MKNVRLKTPAHPQPASRKLPHTPRVFDAQVVEGDVIRFDPTGEQLRVAKIDKGQITFEKLP